LISGPGSRAKSGVRELGAIHAEIGIKNPTAEVAHHLVVDRLAGPHEFMRNPVGLDQARAQCNKHLADD
jgi:hypothetical protein